ncbi:DUF559 domain-containing protein [Arthrobacter sp. UYEF3]|uniref:DUF559 domain-containing protein n=1 Tax=Arthrobacter sp. UYEF3 TaxID=1756365 RepID=UPI0033934075
MFLEKTGILGLNRRRRPDQHRWIKAKKDRRRNNAAVVGGYLVLRFGYDDVVHHPERMIAQVQTVLELQRRGRFGP